MTKIKRVFFGVLIIFGFLTFLNIGNVSAAVIADDGSIYGLSLMQAVETCYTASPRVNVTTADVSMPFPGFGDKNLFSWLWSGALDTEIYIKTNKVTLGSKNDGKIKCSELQGSLSGKYPIPGSMKGLGYILEDKSGVAGGTEKATFDINDVTFGSDHANVSRRTSDSITCTGTKQDSSWVVDSCEGKVVVMADIEGDGTEKNVIMSLFLMASQQLVRIILLLKQQTRII